MERLDVAVHRPNPHDPPRVGAVVSQDRTAYRVRWEDTGDEETVRISPTLHLAARGSLRLEWLLDPAAVAASFATDPDSVIWRVVRESPTPLPVREIKRTLTALGLDPAAVDKAWKHAQPRAATNNVALRRGKYEWTGPREVPDTPVETVAPLPVVTSAAPAPSETDAPQPSRPTAGKPESVAGKPQPAAPLSRIADALGDGPAGQPAGYAERPLLTGTRLGGLAEARLAEIVAAAGKPDRRIVLATLLTVPRQLDALDHSARDLPVDVRTVEGVLVAAAAETAREPVDHTLRAAASWLVSRAARLAEVPTQAVEPLRSLVAYIATGSELAGVADRTARVPLTPTGGRAVLLAALGRVAPGQAAEVRWWSGVSLDDLVAAETGPLGRVIAISAVGQQVIRPMVGQAVRAATSRRQVGFLLALPAEIAAHVDADALATALRRSGQNDPTVGAWLRALSDDERVDALQRELEASRGHATAAHEQAEAAALRFKELEDRYAELENEIRFEHTEAVRLRASQDRQVRIDVISGLAEVAAEAEELAAAGAEATVLVERVRALVAMHDLEPIGRAGEKVDFDPDRHDPIAGQPEPATMVSVIRPGYRWSPAGETVIVARAVVQPS